MPDVCAAYGCSNRRCKESRQRGITFHLFPKAGERRRQWEVALRREDYIVCETSKICSEHFRDEDFDRTRQTVRLKDGVVPTIFHLPAHLQREVPRRSTATCRRVKESLDESEVDELGANGVSCNRCLWQETDHTYGLPTCPKAIKAKLDAVSARVRKLEREKVNALTRERRTKKNIQALLEGLMDKNIFHEELNDVQQMLLVRDDAHPQPSAAVDQQEPEHLHIKEEQEELWTSLEGEQLSVKEETDADMFPVIIKSEEEENPLFSQLHQQEIGNIKEEQEELWTCMDGEQLNVKEETEDTMFPVTIKSEEEENPLFSELHQQEIRNIKKEEEEVWTSMEGEKLNLNEETDATMFLVTIKSEEDEAQPLLSQLHQQEMEDRDVPTSSSADQMTTETGRNIDLNTDEEASMSSETEVSGDDLNLDSELSDRDNDWKESGASDSDGNTVNTCSCSECQKQFLHKRALQSRMTCHLRKKFINCFDNKKSFRKKKTADPHGKVQKQLKSFSCGDCGKILTRKTHLNSHMRIHTGEKPFDCDVCGQTFSLKTSLNSHMRVHTGQKPFKCDVCGQKFSQKDSLNRHTRTHTGHKPFKCELCGQKFSQRNSLNSHIRTHTGQKPFKCDLCGQKFCNKTSLISHIRTHTGEKPFKCNFCGRRFSQKSHLNSHMRVHTGQKPFECEFCKERFSRKDSLNRHMRIHTSGVVKTV